MAASYPVSFDVDRPEKFERPQLVIRVLVGVIIWVIGGWILGLIYLVFPAMAAVFISQKGPEKFLEEDGPRITGWLRWVLAIYAYLGLLTERFPTEKPEQIVRYQVQTGGSPTVGSALLRLIYSIPSAIVLGLLSFVAGIVWLIAAVMVLVEENYADGLYDFLRGTLRWEARLLAYHSSLVEQYPPFALDTGPESSPAV
jgi:hypothetical protein